MTYELPSAFPNHWTLARGFDFYLLVGEMLERWAPEASWEEEKREVRESYHDNPEGYKSEIEAREESLRERREARARFQALFEGELSVTDPRDEHLLERLEGKGVDERKQ